VIATERILSGDLTTELAIHRLGEGRPVLLLHGLFSSAAKNWIEFGHAQRLADAGFEAIMPDLRAHGQSDAPHDPAAYPPGVLVKDLEFVWNAVWRPGMHLVGFSLGARTAAEAVIQGLDPRRLVLGGMGLEGLTGWERRSAFFIDALDRFDSVRHGDPAFFAVSFMKTMKIDREAARLLLGAVEDGKPADLARIKMPTAVVCGAKDQDNGSAQALADALPDGRYIEVPGTHMSSVTEAAFGEAIVSFLSA
jgi:pimeloyl-ACP methyl ester carboxylesterase